MIHTYIKRLLHSHAQYSNAYVIQKMNCASIKIEIWNNLIPALKVYGRWCHVLVEVQHRIE